MRGKEKLDGGNKENVEKKWFDREGDLVNKDKIACENQERERAKGGKCERGG